MYASNDGASLDVRVRSDEIARESDPEIMGFHESRDGQGRGNALPPERRRATVIAGPADEDARDVSKLVTRVARRYGMNEMANRSPMGIHVVAVRGDDHG